MYVGTTVRPLDPDKPNLFTFYVPFSELGLPLAQQGPARALACSGPRTGV